MTTIGGPLLSFSVLEVGDSFAASYCASLFARLGAAVTKVAPPPPLAGSASPAAQRLRHAAALLNDRAKTVVAADQLDAALSGADVVVVGFDTMTRPRIAALRSLVATARAARPDAVVAALTPFGGTGPDADLLGGDLQAQALSGWCSVIGNPDEHPLSMGYFGGGMLHGLAAAGAILASRQAGAGVPGSGGDLVDVSALDVLAATIRTYSRGYIWYGIPVRRAGHRAPGSSGRYPHTVLPCRDGSVILMCRTNDEWFRLVAMMGNPAWAVEPKYQDFFAMAMEYPDDVDALIKPWLAQHTKAELSALAAQFRVSLAPVRTAPEVLADQQLRFREFFERVTDTGREIWLPGIPAHVLP